MLLLRIHNCTSHAQINCSVQWHKNEIRSIHASYFIFTSLNNKRLLERCWCFHVFWRNQWFCVDKKIKRCRITLSRTSQRENERINTSQATIDYWGSPHAKVHGNKKQQQCNPPSLLRCKAKFTLFNLSVTWNYVSFIYIFISERQAQTIAQYSGMILFWRRIPNTHICWNIVIVKECETVL